MLFDCLRYMLSRLETAMTTLIVTTSSISDSYLFLFYMLLFHSFILQTRT